MDYNTYVLDSTDRAFLAEWGTVAFLVIQEDSILYEAYWEDWDKIRQ